MAAPADPLLPLVACGGEPPSRVGRKAALLAWAEADGMATPGGVVVPAEWFWTALEAGGVLGQARYLERSALRLDPRHTLDLAGSIAAAMVSPSVAALARECAGAAFARVEGAPVVCRSSSAMEDGHAAAFPGIFTSVLGITSADALANGVASCWRSAFAPQVVRYLLRLRTEPVDFSLAVLVQPQVVAGWYGVYTSVDPVTGDGEAVADLTDAGPDAVMSGAPVRIQARRGDPSWTEPLELLHQAAQRFAVHLRAEVDLEFALPPGGGPPVILQCRPLTGVVSGVAAAAAGAAFLSGRPCGGGRAAGVGGEGVVVADRLTTADYGVVFGAQAVVTEQDASPLSHLAILCRELGVPFVCGVEGARELLAGRPVVVDGTTGGIELAGDADALAALPPDGPAPEPAMTDVELVLRLLSEGRPGQPAAAEAERLKRRYARALGATSVRVVQQPIAEEELRQLGAFGDASSLLRVVAGGSRVGPSPPT